MSDVRRIAVNLVVMENRAQMRKQEKTVPVFGCDCILFRRKLPFLETCMTVFTVRRSIYARTQMDGVYISHRFAWIWDLHGFRRSTDEKILHLFFLRA